MAREYIKSEGGTLVPIGNTQGLLIPISARGCIGQNTTPYDVPSGSYTPQYTFGTGEDWISAGGIKVPKTGWYQVSYNMVANGSGTERVTIYNLTKNGVAQPQATELTTNSAGDWSGYANSTLVFCNENDILRFTLSMYSGTNLHFQSSRLCVVLVEQQVPDLVANKGALVSGGAFQFDADGHGFTKNYFDTETVVGRWRDGRPVYARTFQKTFSATGPVMDVLDSCGNIDLIVGQDVTYRSVSAWSVNGQIYYGGADPSNLAYIMEVTSNNYNINVWRNVVNSGYLGGVFYITAFYVKFSE
jgi:hypothetical protein